MLGRQEAPSMKDDCYFEREGTIVGLSQLDHQAEGLLLRVDH